MQHLASAEHPGGDAILFLLGDCIEEASVDERKISDLLTNTQKTTTQRYIRRRERGNAEIAKVRRELRKVANDGGYQ